jgi:hypothetical protein
VKYRAHFGLFGWLQVGTACLCLILILSRGGHTFKVGLFPGFTICMLALQRVLNHLFTYWKLEQDGLRVRSMLFEKAIAWGEITSVSGFNGNAGSSTLELDYARTGPLSDRGSVLANPEDRNEFLQGLHRFAPHATFEV